MSVTIKHITEAVGVVFGASVSEIMSDNRSPRCSLPRMVSYYLSQEMTGASLTVIGSHFNRDHTTIKSGIERCAKEKSVDFSKKLELSRILALDFGKASIFRSTRVKPPFFKSTRGDSK